MVIFRCCLHQFQLHLGLVKNLEDSRPQKSSSLQVPTLLGLQAWAWAQQAFGAGAEIWTRILPVVEQRHLPSHLCVTCFSPYVFQLSKSVGRGEREKVKAKSVIVCSRCTNPIPKRKHIFVQTQCERMIFQSPCSSCLFCFLSSFCEQLQNSHWLIVHRGNTHEQSPQNFLWWVWDT